MRSCARHPTENTPHVIQHAARGHKNIFFFYFIKALVRRLAVPSLNWPNICVKVESKTHLTNAVRRRQRRPREVRGGLLALMYCTMMNNTMTMGSHIYTKRVRLGIPYTYTYAYIHKWASNACIFTFFLLHQQNISYARTACD